MHFLEKRGKFFSKHPKLNSSKALLKIVNSYFWKSISGPFLSFIFPIILVCVLGFSLGYNMAFPGAFFMGIIAVGLNVMPGTICEFRKSSLLKRISITPIRPIRILITICLYYLVIMIISIIITICLTLLVFIKFIKNGQTIEIPSIGSITMPSLSQVLANVDYASFIYVTILIFILSLLTGLMFCSFFTSTSTIHSVSIMVMILTILLSGLALPNSVMKSNISLWYVGYVFTPFKSAMCSAYESWNGAFKDHLSGNFYLFQMNNCNGSHVFNMSSSYVIYSAIVLPGVGSGRITILSVTEKWVTIFLPYVWVIIFSIIIGKKFKWGNR